MNLEEITAFLPAHHSRALKTFHFQQQERITSLTAQLEWFRRQYFGAKSERRIAQSSSPLQLCLGEMLEPQEKAPAARTTVTSYERSHRKKHIEFVDDDSKLKFDERVPVEEERVPNPAVEGLHESEYEVIGEKVTYRLVQKPGMYVVRKYVQETIKLSRNDEIVTPQAPASVIPGSFADVSFLAGIVTEKLLYYMPLYRQHQRLTAAGIHIDRGTLTKLFHRVAELLEPIYHSQLSSILQSQILTMDETGIKAGKEKGKMKQGYFWPLYGDNDEIAFLFSSSRGAELIKDTLRTFQGTLLTDGYKVYEKFTLAHGGITHAQCWAHCRRKFVEAHQAEPSLADQVLDGIQLLYAIERQIRDEPMEQRLKIRASRLAVVVENIFEMVRGFLVKNALLPSSPFTKAAHYMLKRKDELSVFLHNPALPIDSNHLERQIRPIALGRKNWMCVSRRRNYAGTIKEAA